MKIKSFYSNGLGRFEQALAVLKACGGAPFTGETLALDGFDGMDGTALRGEENTGFVGKFLENQPAPLLDFTVLLGEVTNFH